jgi:hypothetical protein
MHSNPRTGMRPWSYMWGAPLMLFGAPLQKLRHSVRSHPLKGVEPELFSPEELLGGARRAPPSTSRPVFGSQTPPQSQPGLHRSDSESSDRQQSGSWFQLPWKVSQQDEVPQSRRISRDDRGLPLNQPPLVSFYSCHQQTLFVVLQSLFCLRNRAFTNVLGLQS